MWLQKFNKIIRIEIKVVTSDCYCCTKTRQVCDNKLVERFAHCCFNIMVNEFTLCFFFGQQFKRVLCGEHNGQQLLIS